MKETGAFLSPATPFILHIASSMMAYAGGLAAAQRVGSMFRVSCSTPILAPVLGALGVGFASSLSGEISRQCVRAHKYGYRKYIFSGTAMFRGIQTEDLFIDAVVGIAAFRMLGGVFRTIMPSDLLTVGAVARESIPAKGINYASDSQRKKLAKFYRMHGCHHCGNRRGRVIGDHMPPNKEITNLMAARRESLLRIPLFRLPFLSKLLKPRNVPEQRFYPQCISCSQKQSIAVRMKRSTLVLHDILHRGGRSSGWHYVGILIGLQYLMGSGYC